MKRGWAPPSVVVPFRAEARRIYVRGHLERLHRRLLDGVTSWFSTVHGVHHTNRPHRCHLCFRAFGNKAHLRRHLLSHTGEKPFGCPFCERRFSQACNAKVHVANVHSQAKTRSKPAFEYPGALRGRRSSGRRVPSSVPSATTQPTTRATCRRTSASTPASAPSSVAGARGGSGTGPT
ncbi:putative zinc finger protein [Ixodes scapularis]